MLEIAICDDDQKELSNLVTMLNAYQSVNQADFSYKTFTNPLELLCAIENHVHFDLILLDVVMPTLSGIDSAKEIRQYDSNTRIIFLTASSDFAVESYAVGAYFYALKPILQEDFFALLTKVVNEICREKQESLTVKCKTGFTRILLAELMYCEVINKTIFYHLSTGTTLEGSSSISDLEKQLLHYPAFIKPHRSYIVNMDFIKAFTSKEIILDSNDMIPLPKSKYNEMKQKYLAFSFEGRYFL